MYTRTWPTLSVSTAATFLFSALLMLIPPPIPAQEAALTTELIQRALDAAVARAREIRVPMGIAVVDRGGNLAGFIKMDGAFAHTNHTSYSKAYTAASVRQPTHQSDIPPDIALALTLATEGRFTTLPGGIPIVRKGQVIGGIGAAGGDAKADIDVAQAGAAAVRE